MPTTYPSRGLMGRALVSLISADERELSGGQAAGMLGAGEITIAAEREWIQTAARPARELAPVLRDGHGLRNRFRGGAARRLERPNDEQGTGNEMQAGREHIRDDVAPPCLFVFTST